MNASILVGHHQDHTGFYLVHTNKHHRLPNASCHHSSLQMSAYFLYRQQTKHNITIYIELIHPTHHPPLHAIQCKPSRVGNNKSTTQLTFIKFNASSPCKTNKRHVSLNFYPFTQLHNNNSLKACIKTKTPVADSTTKRNK